jgi:hypothetical protein
MPRPRFSDILVVAHGLSFVEGKRPQVDALREPAAPLRIEVDGQHRRCTA